MSNENLKPCPFCGGQAELQAKNITTTKTSKTLYQIICTECTCSIVDYVYADTAVRAWNRRVD